jgi:hypothetical protein
MKRISLALVLVLFFCSMPAAKKLIPLDIDKGQMFDDNTEQVEASLSEDNLGPKATTSSKITYPATGGWAGLWMPKKSAWDGIKTMTCYIFNPKDKKVMISFVIKDKDHIAGNSGRGDGGWPQRKTWSVKPLELKPGMNEIKVDIAAMKTQEGKDVYLAKIHHWGFYYKFFPEAEWEEKADEPLTIYISKIKLED